MPGDHVGSPLCVDESWVCENLDLRPAVEISAGNGHRSPGSAPVPGRPSASARLLVTPFLALAPGLRGSRWEGGSAERSRS